MAASRFYYEELPVRSRSDIRYQDLTSEGKKKTKHLIVHLENAYARKAEDINAMDLDYVDQGMFDNCSARIKIDGSVFELLEKKCNFDKALDRGQVAVNYLHYPQLRQYRNHGREVMYWGPYLHILFGSNTEECNIYRKFISSDRYDRYIKTSSEGRRLKRSPKSPGFKVLAKTEEPIQVKPYECVTVSTGIYASAGIGQYFAMYGMQENFEDFMVNTHMYNSDFRGEITVQIFNHRNKKLVISDNQEIGLLVPHGVNIPEEIIESKFLIPMSLGEVKESDKLNWVCDLDTVKYSPYYDGILCT